MSQRFAICWGLCTLLASACQSPERRFCHEKMAEAQSAVSGVDSNSVDSLTRSIQLIELAEAPCKQAGLDGELKQLTAAKERLLGHRSLVEERDAKRRAKRELSPRELEKLVREGDPTCPRGQAYQQKASGQQIRCTGIQPVEMGYEQAKRYFAARNFRVVATGDDRLLTLESGGEKVVYHYAVKASQQPASCIIFYSRPGVSWQETVARNSSVGPEKLKDGGVVSVGGLRFKLAVDAKNDIARLGDCPQ